jgi:hypothetical protein
MTLIVSWAALDRKGDKNDVASMYIMSDSRISWGPNHIWDNGRKIFNFQNHPDILGYCGDVLFITQVLSQIITLGDSCLLFNSEDTFSKKSENIFETIISQLNKFPQSKLFPSFSIIHCGKTLKGEFGCRNLSWKKGDGWNTKNISPNEYSDKLIVAGSGSQEFNALYFKRFKSYERKTSREIYQCFIDTMSEIKDPLCGGPPQLAGVYRGDISKTFGIISDEKRYVLGIEIDETANFGEFEWRNELFERCNPVSKKILPEAQRQPKVK